MNILLCVGIQGQQPMQLDDLISDDKNNDITERSNASDIWRMTAGG